MNLNFLSGMAQALGAGADGYSAGIDRQRQLKNEDEDRAYLKAQRQQQLDQQAREKKVRDAIDAAAKDFAVEPIPGEQKPDTMDNRDVGQPGEQALQPSGFRAGGTTYGTQAEAQAAATASAAPQARMQRIASAMESSGDPVGGLKVRSSMQQQQLGDLQLKKAQIEAAQQSWDNDSKQALLKGGPDGFAQFLTESKGDTAGGSAQFKATRSPDGKTWRIDLVGPNGELIPRTQEFTNDARGYAEAHVLFSQGVPDIQKLQHYVAQQNSDTSAKQADANIQHQAGMLKVAQQNADTQEQWRRDQASSLEAKADAGHKDPLARMSEADKATLLDINKRRELINTEITKAKAGGMWRDDDPNAKSLVSELGALGLQASGITAKYGRGDAAPDPLGLRGGAGQDGSAATTRPASMAETIAQDMAKTGTKDALVDINGRRAAYGGAKMSDFATSAVADKGQGGTPSPAAAPAAAPAASSVASILSETAGTDKALRAVMQSKAPAIESALAQVRDATAKFGAVARSGDVRAIKVYQDQLIAARAALQALINDQSPQTQQRLFALAG